MRTLKIAIAIIFAACAVNIASIDEAIREEKKEQQKQPDTVYYYTDDYLNVKFNWDNLTAKEKKELANKHLRKKRK